MRFCIAVSFLCVFGLYVVNSTKERYLKKYDYQFFEAAPTANFYPFYYLRKIFDDVHLEYSHILSSSCKCRSICRLDNLCTVMSVIYLANNTIECRISYGDPLLMTFFEFDGSHTLVNRTGEFSPADDGFYYLLSDTASTLTAAKDTCLNWISPLNNTRLGIFKSHLQYEVLKQLINASTDVPAQLMVDLTAMNETLYWGDDELYLPLYIPLRDQSGNSDITNLEGFVYAMEFNTGNLTHPHVLVEYPRDSQSMKYVCQGNIFHIDWQARLPVNGSLPERLDKLIKKLDAENAA